MSEENNVATKATKKKTEKVTISEPKFVVKTTGYQETFGNQADAKKQYDLLKKRSVKSQETTKLELYELETTGNKKMLENVSIDEDFFK